MAADTATDCATCPRVYGRSAAGRSRIKRKAISPSTPRCGTSASDICAGLGRIIGAKISPRVGSPGAPPILKPPTCWPISAATRSWIACASATDDGTTGSASISTPLRRASARSCAAVSISDSVMAWAPFDDALADSELARDDTRYQRKARPSRESQASLRWLCLDQARVRERIMKLSKLYSATCHQVYWSPRKATMLSYSLLKPGLLAAVSA